MPKVGGRRVPRLLMCRKSTEHIGSTTRKPSSTSQSVREVVTFSLCVQEGQGVRHHEGAGAGLQEMHVSQHGYEVGGRQQAENEGLREECEAVRRESHGGLPPLQKQYRTLLQ